MHLKLEFQPDAIYYFEYGSLGRLQASCGWGDKSIKETCYEYLLSLAKGQTCFIAIQKGTLKHQIVLGTIERGQL